MARIIKLAGKSAERFGYKRATPKGRPKESPPGQLSLFTGRPRILQMPTTLSRFEAALLAHENGDPSAAARYRDAIEHDDCSADAWCNLGIIESQAGNHKLALECFSNSLQEDSGLFETHYNLGNLHLEMGNIDSAKLHYEVARSIDHNYPNLYFNLALVLALSDDIEGAIETLRQYLEVGSTGDNQKVNELLRQLVETKTQK
jgi:tetratricopeptide (TPR) repeat protein